MSEIYLPCHLRDKKWLSKLLHEKLKSKERIYIAPESIFNFIHENERFDELRHNYEIEIVRWQIDQVMKGKEDYILPEGYKSEISSSASNIDKKLRVFRDGVVTTLTAIGMDRNVVEEGLEKNDYWRQEYMETFFDETYNPIITFIGAPGHVNKNHKRNWMAVHEYDYYQETKESVDKYGQPTPAMKMSEEEYQQLKEVLKIQNEERDNLIKEFTATLRVPRKKK